MYILTRNFNNYTNNKNNFFKKIKMQVKRRTREILFRKVFYGTRYIEGDFEITDIKLFLENLQENLGDIEVRSIRKFLETDHSDTIVEKIISFHEDFSFQEVSKFYRRVACQDDRLKLIFEDRYIHLLKENLDGYCDINFLDHPDLYIRVMDKFPNGTKTMLERVLSNNSIYRNIEYPNILKYISEHFHYKKQTFYIDTPLNKTVFIKSVISNIDDEKFIQGIYLFLSFNNNFDIIKDLNFIIYEEDQFSLDNCHSYIYLPNKRLNIHFSPGDSIDFETETEGNYLCLDKLTTELRCRYSFLQHYKGRFYMKHLENSSTLYFED